MTVDTNLLNYLETLSLVVDLLSSGVSVTMVTLWVACTIRCMICEGRKEGSRRVSI